MEQNFEVQDFIIYGLAAFAWLYVGLQEFRIMLLQSILTGSSDAWLFVDGSRERNPAYYEVMAFWLVFWPFLLIVGTLHAQYDRVRRWRRRARNRTA